MSVLSDESDVYKQESFPGGSAVKTLSANAADADSIPGLGRSPRKGNSSTLVLLPGKSHGQRSLASFSPGGHKE